MEIRLSSSMSGVPKLHEEKKFSSMRNPNPPIVSGLLKAYNLKKTFLSLIKT